jgi:hypothetical protein
MLGQLYVGILLVVFLMLTHAGATAPTSAFVPIQDVRNATFFIGRLDIQDQDHIESCYEVRRTLDAGGFTFCYPAIVINGFGGCATSELEHFLPLQPFIATNGAISECPEPTMSVYDHLERFSKISAVGGRIHMSTCMWPSTMQIQVVQALHARSAHIYVVCNQPDRAWNLYNMFCDHMYDTDCKLHTTSAMYRSPMMFDQLLRRQQFPLAVKSAVNPQLNVQLAPSCAAFEKIYTQHTAEMASVVGHHPLILASEALDRSHPHFNAQMLRLEAYLNKVLGQKWTLDIAKFPVSSTGAAVSGSPEIQVSRTGLYEVSRYRPLLPATVQHIMDCWKECTHISQVSGYAYNCSASTDV